MKSAVSLLVAILFLAGFAIDYSMAADPQTAGKCMTCHKEISPGLYNQWANSNHAENDIVVYSYSLQPGYRNLTVVLDGVAMGARCGSIGIEIS